MFLEVPVWVLVFLGLLAGWGLVVTYLHFVDNPLPVPDNGSTTFACPNVDAMVVLSRIMVENGIKQRLEANSAQVSRRIFSNSVILATTNTLLHARMGNPSAAIGIVSADPFKQASHACSILRAAGFEAEIFEEVADELPPNHLVSISTNALMGSGLIFRRSILTLMRRTRH